MGAALGHARDEAYEAAVAEGRSWDVEDAIDRTLEMLSEPGERRRAVSVGFVLERG